ncbi:MAG: hypothetical protein PHE98_17280 [Thauera propionica]|nr:hypothetical protein [Thauera propionica]MDD3677273.1 hypothetical protein [Thauera propionica]
MVRTMTASRSRTASLRRFPAGTTSKPNGTLPPFQKPSAAFFAMLRRVSFAIVREYCSSITSMIASVSQASSVSPKSCDTYTSRVPSRCSVRLCSAASSRFRANRLVLQQTKKSTRCCSQYSIASRKAGRRVVRPEMPSSRNTFTTRAPSAPALAWHCSSWLSIGRPSSACRTLLTRT